MASAGVLSFFILVVVGAGLYFWDLWKADREKEEVVERPKAGYNLHDNRDPDCVRKWPQCFSGEYDPKCCRFPKSCSAGTIGFKFEERKEEK